MKTVIFSFTGRGGILAAQISALLPNTRLVADYKSESLQAQAKAAFQSADCLIFVGAAGIAVRAIAPFIRAKDKDPAVIVVDEKARFFIPILSGHIGGANATAKTLAAHFGGQPVLTTATDVNHCFAVDLWAKKNHLSILNLSAVKHISASLLKGNPVNFSSFCPIDGPFPPYFKNEEPNGVTPSIVICEAVPTVFLPQTLYLLPKQYALGVGCKKDVPAEVLEEAVRAALEAYHIPFEALRTLGTIDIKAQENAILALAKKYRLPLYFYTAEELAAAPGIFTASDFVKKTTGVDNVCERSAVLLTAGGELVIQKTAKSGVTVAAAKHKLCLHYEVSKNEKQ